MPDWATLVAILALGAVSFAMRAGGYLMAGVLPATGLLPRLLRLAPGNLCVAFGAAGVVDGGWPHLAGCVAAVAGMAATEREWVSLGAGFGAAALVAAIV
jgi:hypothetical protein